MQSPNDKGEFLRHYLIMTDMTPKQIKAALEAGIITDAQAKAMHKTQALSDTHAVIGNEDDMRFVRSFSDVFIGIGIGLFALGLWALGGLTGGGMSYLFAAGVMALMAGYFGRKTRQHLPTLITALAFLIFTHKGLGGVLGINSEIMTALITIVAMLAYYAFIRLPFCIALIAISVIFLVFALANQFSPNALQGNKSWLFITSGLVTLCVAIYYDMKDTQRKTRFADNAFWLHLTAAPLIVHGLAFRAAIAKSDMLLGLVPVLMVEKTDAIGLLVIVGLIGLLGLALNRRALLVSSLGYAGFAIVFLFSGSGVGFGLSLALAFLLLGATVIFLGAGWHKARNTLIKILPKWKIFPPAYKP